MSGQEHIDNGRLIGFLDGELSDSDFEAARRHLASCLLCRTRRDEFANLSGEVEALVSASPTPDVLVVRNRLAQSLTPEKAPENGRRLFAVEHFGWRIGLAAALALGVLFAPHFLRFGSGGLVPAGSAGPPRGMSINVNGENFVALPYSNPDLPLSAPQIVEMQVPVSALAAQGLLIEPAGGAASDRTVLANVLLGIDGQPLGVHVLAGE